MSDHGHHPVHLPDDTSLVDLLDRVIDTGAVLVGDVTLSVAEVDLVRLDLALALTRVEGPRRASTASPGPPPPAGSPEGPRRAQPPPTAAPRARRPTHEGPSRSTPGPDPAPDAPVAGLAAQLDDLVDRGRRGDAQPEDVQRGLAGLVLTLVEVLRELMERQAVRRMESESLTADEEERLGRTFQALRERLDELKDVFGLTDEDLNLDLGPLGRLR